MTYHNIFSNPDFNDKYEKVKYSIKQYLTNNEYQLNEFTIDDLITWKDVGTRRRVEITEKCPSDIKTILGEFIMKEFPYTDEV